jgi:diguanylate cyclase (GGDEF)-like protein
VADSRIRDQLGAFEMLRGVSLAARTNLLYESDERAVDRGEVLIRGGEPNETMYLLVEGELGVHVNADDDEPIAVIGAGETVGELSLLDGGVTSATVVAREPCLVLAVSEQVFWALVNDSHAFAVQLLVKLAERLRTNNSTVSVNVEKRRLYERAAMFDGLTGIHNRRWLDTTLHRVVKRSRMGSEQLCVSLIDIDHFKRFNDTCGHEAGDFVLTAVANTLTEHLRPTDLVARFGGEEFVIIFSDTALDEAAVAADRVRRAVEAKSFAMPDGRELPRVTISMGVAQLEPGQDVPGLLKAADAAMYQAKHQGRNRVVTA